MYLFFSSIYGWFCDRSMTVYKIMEKIENDDQEQLLSSLFPAMGWTTIAISFAVAIGFYIWPLNHPRFKAWWAWLIMFLLNAAVNFVTAFAFIGHRESDIEKAPDGEALELFTDAAHLSIPFGQQIDLAFSNMMVGVMAFLVASLILNWFSVNCRYSPFRS